MSFAPCVVIPIYNHKETIGLTLQRLAPYDLPLWVVDDGSDAATRQVLETLAAQSPRIRLLRLETNRGKGAAVMAGLRAAYAAGFSHALQIDADGQHDTADVPRFLDAARSNPQAMVLGQPSYDKSVPKARLYGRYLTHVWVWIETLSFDIRDSMCGFRVYPLAATCALLDQVRLPQRMAFDIEILVRLHWRQVPFITLATRVTYATDGVSHFDVWRDNLRISQSHARLSLGMVCRLPGLIAAKFRSCPTPPGAAKPWWHIAERGSRFGMSLLVLSCRCFGRRITSLWLHPIVIYFVLTSATARAASRNYLVHLAASRPEVETPRPGWSSSYRHLLAFAQAGLDKLAAWANQLPAAEIEFTEAQAFQQLLASGRGALVIGAHLGNLEMMRALAVIEGRARITAIVYTENAGHFTSVLAAAHEKFGMNLIEVDEIGPDTAMMMQALIDAGELLVMVGDRIPAHERGRVVEVPFLGAPAPFAQGPYILGHLLACPVYLFFCLKEAGRYRMYFELFAERIELPRGARQAHLAGHAARYAARLEYYCGKAPLQWFNFFDFWQRPHGAPDEYLD